VERQAAMVALVRVFQYMTVMVLALIPLIFLTKRPHKGESSPPNGRRMASFQKMCTSGGIEDVGPRPDEFPDGRQIDIDAAFR
jgi:hypothetical protein